MAGEENKMAHIITDVEAQALTRIAKSFIGPIVSQGVIQKRDMDDAVQELLQEAIRLSEAHGVMKIQIFRVIRKLRSATTRILTDAIPIDVVCEAEDTDDVPDYRKIGMVILMPGEATTQEDRRQHQILLVRSVMNSLSPDMRKICYLLIAGCSASEISRRTALSRKAVRIRISSIKQALIKSGVIICGKKS